MENMKFMQAYKSGEAVDVTIKAVIYVPERILTGICFPAAEVENEFPHLTIMLAGGWKPVNSNAVIQATCKEGAPFADLYQAVKKGDFDGPDMSVVQWAADVEVQLTRNKNEKVPRVYLVVFDESTAVKFAGVTKEFN